MDSMSFASLAQVRILLVPVGSIRRQTFDKWAEEIRTFETIRLGDIPADPHEEKARFMPNPLASGYLHLSFAFHPPPAAHAALSVFRPSEFPLGIIGIASCAQSDSLSDILARFTAIQNELFPTDSTYPLASNCFVFEETDDTTQVNLGDALPGLVIIPSMMGNKKIYLGTLLADLCSNILAEFSTLIQTLESPLGNEYLNASTFPMAPSASDMPKSLDVDSPMRSSLPPLPSFNSQPDLPTSASRSKTPTPLNLKRTSSVGPSVPPSPYRHTSLPTPGNKKKQNTLGAASSHGRLFKVLGDLFLLAGRLMDASVWYTEAIAVLRGPQDIVWHASALEGLATIPVIEGWSSPQNINGQTGDKEPWADIADKLTQAIALYSRAASPADGEINYPVLSSLYARAVLRHTMLLFCVWSAKGWGPHAFSLMLQPRPFTLTSPIAREGPSMSSQNEAVPHAELERLSAITNISRASIATILLQAHGPWLLHLIPRERISILEAVASLYGSIGYRRKEAYILREVFGCIMDLIVCSREESGGARIIGAGLGIQGVRTNGSADRGTVGIRENDSTLGNESILKVVKYVCRVHGIDLEAVKIVDSSTSGRPTSIDAEDDADDPDFLNASHEPFGWPELQIGIVREAIAVAESLPDYPSVAQFSLSALKSLHPVMSESDQKALYGTASRAVSTAKRRGDTRIIEYWSGRPVVSIEILPPPLVRLPIEKPISVLSQRRSDLTPIVTGITDPFLYNPRKSLSGQGQALLVQNETFELVVTLRNPFVFDLELTSLAVSTSGVPIETRSIPMIIPANSFHPVTMTVKPLEPGSLTIRGCIVQAPGSIPREFVLPLSTEEEEQKQSRRRSAIECEVGRSKHAGLDSRPWEKAGKRFSGAMNTQKQSIRLIQCKVVPAQPLLRIRRTSLTHGAVMLYNGETSTIRITFENVSTLPIDFLRLTFDDSTIGPAQQALAEGEMSVFETYETEYDLIHRPVFSWESKRNPSQVGPGEKVVVLVKCFGKVGCTSGAIHVSYSFVNRPQTSLQEPLEVFHTRQLTYPVLVTVYHMLECHGMDILPYSPDTVASTLGDDDLNSRQSHDILARRQLLNVDSVADWCIFSVDVRNTYGVPFEVTFERIQPDAEHAEITSLVPPGSTTRIVIPVKKFRLSEKQVAQPIPTLSDRQYVVTKSSLTNTEERTQRELFWYREELFKYIRGRWKERGGTRSGELSLRQQRMTLPMLEVMRIETARVQLSLIERNAEAPAVEPVVVEHHGGRWAPIPNSFVYFRVQVTNLSPASLVLLLDFHLEPMRYTLYEGVPTDIPLGRLKPGSSKEIEIPVAFISSGRFEITAIVRTLDQPKDRGKVGQGQLHISVAS
ncbi:Trs120-domain-containing protein [Panus rudis PR-1116 ss-1]|nr:Trs120-domain-containing protein [Panus rudis PR-1116 ss-1]